MCTLPICYHRCGPDIRKWHDSCSVQSGKPTSVSPDKVADAVTWLDSCSRDPNGSQVSTPGNGHEPSVMLEALQIAMSDRCVSWPRATISEPFVSFIVSVSSHCYIFSYSFESMCIAMFDMILYFKNSSDTITWLWVCLV